MTDFAVAGAGVINRRRPGSGTLYGVSAVVRVTPQLITPGNTLPDLDRRARVRTAAVVAAFALTAAILANGPVGAAAVEPSTMAFGTFAPPAGPSVATATQSAASTQTGKVSGRVTSETGEPISRVSVTLTKLGEDQISTSAYTDGSGRFSVSGLAGGTYKAFFDPPAGPYLPEYWDDEAAFAAADSFVLSPGGVESGLDAELTRGGSITGTVVDTFSRPVHGYVELYRQGVDHGYGTWAFNESEWTDTSGNYAFEALEAGVYTLLFYNDSVRQWWGGRSIKAEAESITVSLGEAKSGINPVLDAPGSISGRVLLPDGAPTADTFDLRAVRVAIGSTGELVENGAYGGWARGTDGYSFPDLPPGTYTLWVEGSGPYVDGYLGGSTSIADAETFTVGSGESRAGVDYRLLKGATLSGALTAPDAAPVEGAVVELYERRTNDDGLWWREINQTLSSGDGGYSFTGVPAGEYTLSFRDSSSRWKTEWWDDQPGPASAEVIVATTGQVISGLDVEFGGEWEIGGTVTTGPGAVVADALITLERRDPDNLDRWVAVATSRSDAGGRYSFVGLQSDSYRVGFSSVPGFASEWWGDAHVVSEATPVVIRNESRTDIDAKLDPAAGIAGVVSGPDHKGLSGKQVSAYRQTRGADGTLVWVSVGQDATDSSGAYRIEGLPPGHYTLYFSGYVGFVSEWWGDTTAEADAVNFSLEAGVVLREYDAVLGRNATIGGSVTVAGAARDGVRVRAYRQSEDTPRIWQLESAAWVTATGVYQVPGLRPGRYIVEFEGDGITTEWWDNQPDLDAAVLSAFTLSANENKAGVDADLEPLLILQTDEPTIVGDVFVGTKLAADPGQWTEGTSYDYEWQIDGEVVDDATESTFALTAQHIGSRISVSVTGSRWGYETASRLSMESGVVSGGPLTSAEPTIIGTPSVGSMLSVRRGNWTSGTTFTYLWLANELPIVGATTSTLVVTPKEAGTRISVVVTGTKRAYDTASRASAATDYVTGGVLTTAKPTIAGTVAVGATLKAVPGTWTAGTTFTYTWFAGGVEVPGADSAAFLVSASTLGKSISVSVTGSKPGFTDASRVSPATVPVVQGTLKAPIPSIAGLAAVGGTLSAAPGTWTSGTTLTYQWYVNDAAVAGATKTTFTLTAGHAGKQLSVKVTGKKSAYVTAAKTSAKTLKVTLAATPAISGSAVVGQKLTTKVGTWTAGMTFTYQWFASGKPITGATASTLTVKSVVRGKSITVKVTGKKSGYTTVAKSSTPTAPVK